MHWSWASTELLLDTKPLDYELSLGQQMVSRGAVLTALYSPSLAGTYFGEPPLFYTTDSDSDSDYDEEASCYEITLQADGFVQYFEWCRESYGHVTNYKRKQAAWQESGDSLPTWQRNVNSIHVNGSDWSFELTEEDRGLQLSSKPKSHKGHWPKGGLLLRRDRVPIENTPDGKQIRDS